MNWLLNLTYRELEVFCILVEHELFADDKDINYSKLRKKVMATTSINRHNLTKYMKVFVDKGLVICQGRNKEIILNKEILPEIIDNEINIQYRLFINGHN